MSELIKREDLENWLRTECYGTDTDEDKEYVIERLRNELHTASPWHRVEEPPKEHGKYPVCWFENGNFYWQEAHYCYYQDGDKWVAWSSYQGDDVEITPDYWMPVEPPKEDNNG